MRGRRPLSIHSLSPLFASPYHHHIHRSTSSSCSILTAAHLASASSDHQLSPVVAVIAPFFPPSSLHFFLHHRRRAAARTLRRYGLLAGQLQAAGHSKPLLLLPRSTIQAFSPRCHLSSAPRRQLFFFFFFQARHPLDITTSFHHLLLHRLVTGFLPTTIGPSLIAAHHSTASSHQAASQHQSPSVDNHVQRRRSPPASYY